MSPRYCKHGNSSKCCPHCDTEQQLRFEIKQLMDTPGINEELQKANERITEALNECQNANGSLAFAHARLMDENTKLKTALENIIKHQGIVTGNSQIMKTTVQRIAEEALSKN